MMIPSLGYRPRPNHISRPMCPPWIQWWGAHLYIIIIYCYFSIFFLEAVFVRCFEVACRRRVVEWRLKYINDYITVIHGLQSAERNQLRFFRQTQSSFTQTRTVLSRPHHDAYRGICLRHYFKRIHLFGRFVFVSVINEGCRFSFLRDLCIL